MKATILNTIALDFYLDESGTFGERSPALGLSRPGHGEPSQLVGLMVPRGAGGEEIAEAILSRTFARHGRALPATVHAVDLSGRTEIYADLVQDVLTGVSECGWQPVRLVNAEGVGFGDIVANYTSMVAELVVRSLRQAGLAPGTRLQLRIIAARVKTLHSFLQSGTLMVPLEYTRRMREYLIREAIQRGMAAEVKDWDLRELIDLQDARQVRMLQLCDVLSNASFRNYAKPPKDVAERLRMGFGLYDMSLARPAILEALDLLLAQGSHGMALTLLMDAVCRRDKVDDILQQGLGVRLERILDLLENAADPMREAQWPHVLAYLDHACDPAGGDEAALSRAMAEWCLNHLVAPLRERLGQDRGHLLDGFALGLQRQRLTACNHLADLGEARRVVDELDVLAPVLAGQWDVIPKLADAWIARGVHHTDTMDFIAAERWLNLVTSYYRTSGGLFSGKDWTESARLRSRRHGEALGTLLQAQMYAALVRDMDFEAARQTHHEAMGQFIAPDDLARQHQYRAQLETYAGQFDLAVQHLCLAIGLAADTDAGQLGQTIVRLREAERRFIALHWLRLGAHAGTSGQEGLFRVVCATVPELRPPSGSQPQYPWHGMLRQIAVLEALSGQGDAAEQTLEELLSDNVLARRRWVLGVLQAAATAEVAGVLWQLEPARAERLVRRLAALLEVLKQGTETQLPSIWRVMASWPAVLPARGLAERESAVAAGLLKLGRRVGY